MLKKNHSKVRRIYKRYTYKSIENIDYVDNESAVLIYMGPSKRYSEALRNLDLLNQNAST